MQLEGVHPHVMGTLDVLQDDEYLLMFMPLLCSSGGGLFMFVQQAGRFPEPVAHRVDGSSMRHHFDVTRSQTRLGWLQAKQA